MKIKQLLLTIVLFAVAINMNAQFKIDAQYRVRGQALHGYKKPVAEETEAAYHIGQRTRLNLRYANEKYSSLLSIQDVRTWGDANIVNATGVAGKSFNNIDIYEAWINFKFKENGNLKIGRQEMKYDDQRHISWRNWWDTGMTYDAITYTNDNKETGWRFDLSGSYNSTNQDLTGNDFSGMNDYFGTVNPIQTQNFLYIKKNFDNKMYLSFTAITSGYQQEDSNNTLFMTNTEGLHFNYNATKKGVDGIFGVANAFIQNGKNISGKKISANMLTAQLGYRTNSKKLEISAKIERLSGQDAEQSDDADYADIDHTYNLLNGARHPYYEGYLDWFVVPKSTNYGGLMNIGLKVSYKLNKKDMLWFEYSNISSSTNVANANGYYDAALASTIDFTYVRKVCKDIKWTNGFSYGMPTDDFNAMKGITEGGSNYFFYSMVVITPKFFDSSKK